MAITVGTLNFPVTGTDPKIADKDSVENSIETLVQGVADQANTRFNTLELAATLGFPLYDDTAAGIAGTSDGETFSVVGSSTLDLYENDGGSAVLLISLNALSAPLTYEIVADGVVTGITFTGVYTNKAFVQLTVNGIDHPPSTFSISNDGTNTTLDVGEAFPVGARVRALVQRQVAVPVADAELITLPDSSSVLDLWWGNRIFPDLATFNAATIPAAVTSVWVLTDEMVLRFQREASATYTGLKAGWVPGGDVYPQHFGAVSDWDSVGETGTDNTAAFLALRDWVERTGADNRRWMARGHYLITGPIVFSQFGVEAKGGGIGTTSIVGDHLEGPIIQFRKSFCEITDLRITSGPNREAESYDPNHTGLLIGDFDWENPATGPGASGAHVNVHQVSFQKQPGSGLTRLGSGGTISFCEFLDNKGHGVHVDTGEEFGIVADDLGFPGWTNITDNKMDGNGGNAIAVSDPDINDQPIYRIRIDNNDVANNCTDAAVRKSLYPFHIVGEQIRIGGNATTGDGGMYIAGRNIRVDVNRFPSLTSGAAIYIGETAGYQTWDVEIDSTRVVGGYGSLDPLVIIDASIPTGRGIVVKAPYTSNITRVVSVADRLKCRTVVENVTTYLNGPHYLNSVPVATAEALTSFSPTFTFATPNDLSVVYDSLNKGHYKIFDDDTGFINVQLRVTPTFSTASGVALIGGWPVEFVPDDTQEERVLLPVTQAVRIAYGSLQMLSARPNSGTQMRVLGSTSGGTSTTDLTTTHFTSGSLNILQFQGWVKLA